MQRRAALCSALIGVALAALTPAFAQTASTPAAKMDIAGVRIGMTEAEFMEVAMSHQISPYEHDPSATRAGEKTADFDRWSAEGGMPRQEAVTQIIRWKKRDQPA